MRKKGWTREDRRMDIAGQTFNLLTAEHFVETNNNRHTVWRFKCRCGNYVNKIAKEVKRGKIKSCGCLIGNTTIVHGNFENQFYGFWTRLKNRCNNPKYKSYKHYGGRGVGYTVRWEKFKNFEKDMLERYNEASKKFGKEHLSLDRIDTDGNYCKENCRFIPNELQNSNRQNNKWVLGISPRGIKYCFKNQKRFCKEYGLERRLVNKVLHKTRISHKRWNFYYIENLKRFKVRNKIVKYSLE